MTMRKSELLYENLKKQAIDGMPGEPFLSFRTIMADYGVSQSTVTKATRKLLEEGLLRKKPGQEMELTGEVLKYRSGASPVICLALPNFLSEWYGMIEQHFFDLAGTLDYELEVLHYDWRCKVPPMLPRTKLDALVLVTDAPMLSSDDLRTINDFQLPCVIFGRNLSGMALHCVSSDDEYAGARAAHHLIELGHQSLAVVISEPKSESVTDRIKGFRQFCERCSVNAEIIDCGIENGDFSAVKVYRTLSERFRKGRPGYTGLFSLCEASAGGIYRACAECSVRIPHDLSVITIGESWRAEYMLPPLSTIGRDLDELAAATVEILKSPDAAGPNFAHRLLKPRLMARGSTRPRRPHRLPAGAHPETARALTVTEN